MSRSEYKESVSVAFGGSVDQGIMSKLGNSRHQSCEKAWTRTQDPGDEEDQATHWGQKEVGYEPTAQQE